MNRPEKVYIGDGVYADNDGFSIELTTENGIAVTNRIVLEPIVLAALISYINSLARWREERALQ